MKHLRRLYLQMGLDGIVSLILAIVGIGVTIYDFLGGNQMSQMVLVAILSVLLIEVIFQRIHIDKAKSEIIDSLKGVTVEMVADREDHVDKRYQLLLNTEKYICDTELHLHQGGTIPYSPGSQSIYSKLLSERLLRNELTVRYVQVITEQWHLESLLWKLLRFHENRYYAGYFRGSLNEFPVLNTMIFDGKNYLLGGFYPSVLGEADRSLYLRHELIGQVLCQYFDHLWSKTIILKDKHGINWDEIRDCGLSLGYTPDQLNFTIVRIAKAVGFPESQLIKI